MAILVIVALPLLDRQYSSKSVSGRNYDQDTIRNLHRELRNAEKMYEISHDDIEEQIAYIDSLKTINGKKDSVNRFIATHEKLYNKRLAAERVGDK